MTDPQLTSDLSKYYVQRNQYERAAKLLRPLAAQNVAHKKTELADLDALWGDACFNKGDTEQAMHCWEEIKTLGEGSRFNEVDTRLATIYQKMSNELLAKNDLEGALKYLNNLNTVAPSPASFEKTAELYGKLGKLDLGIDQLKQAIKLGNGSHELNRKLALLMSKRGKELLDKGDTDTGYAYLQQAQGYDSSMKVPTVALRAIAVNVDNVAGAVRSSGEAWNPGPNPVSFLAVKVELYDAKTSQITWTREQKIVDEFVAPLPAKEARPFEIIGPVSAPMDGLEVRIYLDGSLYKSYPIGAPIPKGDTTGNATVGNGNNSRGNSASANNASSQNSNSQNNNSAQPGATNNQNQPPVAPNFIPLRPPIQVQNPPANNQMPPTAPGMTPEERTLKDLE